jgi:lipoprotein NlpI
LLNNLETTEIGKKTAEKEMERAEEERDEMWGWNILEEEPNRRAGDVERERMVDRLREAEDFIAGVAAEIEAAGAVRENG